MEHSQHQVSKTARVVAENAHAVGAGSVVSSTDGTNVAPGAGGLSNSAANNKMLNRDLIATSSENLNDDLSPKSSGCYQ